MSLNLINYLNPFFYYRRNILVPQYGKHLNTLQQAILKIGGNSQKYANIANNCNVTEANVKIEKSESSSYALLTIQPLLKLYLQTNNQNQKTLT